MRKSPVPVAYSTPSTDRRSPDHLPGGCFVTGTDTGVGKTVVAAALACRLRQGGEEVGIMKPIETGVSAGLSIPSDAERLRTAIESRDPLDLINPYRFSAPLAPLAAARLAGTVIRLDRLKASFNVLAARSSFMVIEGIGGVTVPISPRLDVRDLIILFGLPAVIVGRATLGGVNHALLTVEALRRRKVPMLGIVLNRPSTSPQECSGLMQIATTVALVKERSGLPVLGPLHHENLLDQAWSARVSRMATDPVIRELADLVRRGPSGKHGPFRLRPKNRRSRK
jgi:dethiobiotin synthetase